MVVSQIGGTPIAGWFISWKILSDDFGVSQFFGNQHIQQYPAYIRVRQDMSDLIYLFGPFLRVDQNQSTKRPVRDRRYWLCH
jgi:hypothetical protein